MGEQIKRISSSGELKGKYANYFKAGFNAFEFVIDFGQYYLEENGATLHTRIITNPESAKALIDVLRKSISQYEKIHGSIGSKDVDI